MEGFKNIKKKIGNTKSGIKKTGPKVNFILFWTPETMRISEIMW